MSMLLMGKTLSVCSAQCGFGDLVLDSIRPQGLDDSCPLNAGECSKSLVGRSSFTCLSCGVSPLSAGARSGRTSSTSLPASAWTPRPSGTPTRASKSLSSTPVRAQPSASAGTWSCLDLLEDVHGGTGTGTWLRAAGDAPDGAQIQPAGGSLCAVGQEENHQHKNGTWHCRWNSGG